MAYNLHNINSLNKKLAYIKNTQQLQKNQFKNLKKVEVKQPIDIINLSKNKKKTYIISPYNQKTSLSKAKKLLNKLNIEIKEKLPIINSLTVSINQDQLKKLKEIIGKQFNITENKQSEFPDENGIIFPKIPEQKVNQEIKSKLVNEALKIGAKVQPSLATLGIDKIWQKGYTGKGLVAVVIDSGIYKQHPDLEDKLIYYKDFTNAHNDIPEDKVGHGTHVSSLIAGSGKASDGIYKGVAPDAKLIVLRVSNEVEAIKALQWVIENKDKYNIGVVNMSLGVNPEKSFKQDPWAQASEKVVDAGISVVAVAGNDYTYQTIDSPGFDPKVITVGAFDDKGTIDQSDDTIAPFSSRGPTPIDGLHKPDILAPGVNITGALSPHSNLDIDEDPQKQYLILSGTSQAAPIVSGVILLLKQANPDLTPEQIKTILKSTAKNFKDYDIDTQGSGIIQPLKALALVESLKKTTDNKGN